MAKRDILPAMILYDFAYPTSTWASDMGRKTTGAWHVSGYRGNRASPSYNRPELLAGPFDTRDEAKAARDAIRAQVKTETAAV
jgi:hypothetical protein